MLLFGDALIFAGSNYDLKNSVIKKKKLLKKYFLYWEINDLLEN